MNLIDYIFPGRTIEKKLKKYFRGLRGYAPVYTSFHGGVYEMELTRACIDAIATHCSKLNPEVVEKQDTGLAYILQNQPNAFMSTSQFLYRTATILYIDNTAFIIPLFDEVGNICGYYPILPSMAEMCQDEDEGQLYVNYCFPNGESGSVEYERVGILTRYQYQDDFFGTDNHCMQPTLDLLHIQNQGIERGIKNATYAKFYGNISNFSTHKDIAKETVDFSERNFGADKESSILLFPNTYSNITQMRAENHFVDSEQMKAIETRVFDYFGCNESVLQNKTYGDEWNAFYEGKIEPFALQLSLAMTNMTFHPWQRKDNKIHFSSDRLQYMSNADKLQFVTQLFDRGLINRNAANRVLNMPPVEGGEKYYIRKEYAEINKLDDVSGNGTIEVKMI